MKVMLRMVGEELSAYIPKKDLESKVIATDPEHAFGGLLELENGMKILVPAQDSVPRLPLTVNAKKV